MSYEEATEAAAIRLKDQSRANHQGGNLWKRLKGELWWKRIFYYKQLLIDQSNELEYGLRQTSKEACRIEHALNINCGTMYSFESLFHFQLNYFCFQPKLSLDVCFLIEARF